MNTDAIIYRRIVWKDYEHTLRELRHDVFVKEQRVSPEEEWDGRDEAAIHFLASLEVDGKELAIATARLLATGQVGRMAVRKNYRSQGVGSELLALVISTAREQNMSKLFLHAQIAARAFYQRAGFQAYGEEFWEAGIRHQSMAMKLD